DQPADDGSTAIAADVGQATDAPGLGDQSPSAIDHVDEVGIGIRRLLPIRGDPDGPAVVGPALELVGLLAAVSQSTETRPVGPDQVNLRIHPATGGDGD